MKPHTEGSLQRGGFEHTYIHQYTHFGTFSYRYGGCLPKPLEALKDFLKPYTERVCEASIVFVHTYIHI